MKEYLSVNEVLANRAELDGNGVEVEGILEAEPEGYYIRHYPKSERIETNVRLLAGISGVWIQFGNGSVAPNRAKLEQWIGKRVRVHGIVGVNHYRDVEGQLVEAGSGHWSMWSAHIEPYTLQRVTAEQRREESGF